MSPSEHQPTRKRRRAQASSEAGVANGAIMALVLVVSVVVGLFLGSGLRRNQPFDVPPMALGEPVERSTTSTIAVPRSTLDLPTTVDTTLPPDTTLAPVTDPPITQADVPVPELGLSADGAMLRGSGEVRLVNRDLGCDGFTRDAAPGSARGCSEISVGETQLMWLNNASADQFELMVRDGAVDEGDQWRVALSGPADDGSQPAVADVTGDGRVDLVFSRTTGNGELKIDVIDVSASDASVVLHVDLPNGRAREANGQLVVWFTFGQEGKLAEVTLNRASGSWEKVSTVVVDQSSVGSSQF
jgi:hypothetical protein